MRPQIVLWQKAMLMLNPKCILQFCIIWRLDQFSELALVFASPDFLDQAIILQPLHTTINTTHDAVVAKGLVYILSCEWIW